MKKFKQLFTGVTVALLAIFSLTSCEKNDVRSPASTSTHVSVNDALSDEYLADKGSLSFELTAGQSIDAGKVVITKDAENLYITYITKDGWRLQEVHAKIENATTYIPKSNKDLAPGLFPYSQTFTGNACELPTRYTITIPLSSVNCIDAIIYAHAAVVKCDDCTVVQSETAWGGSIVPPSKGIKWYGYIICKVK